MWCPLSCDAALFQFISFILFIHLLIFYVYLFIYLFIFFFLGGGLFLFAESANSDEKC